MPFRRPPQWLTYCLLTLCVWFSAQTFATNTPSMLRSRLLRKKVVTQVAWKIIEANQIMSGTILPSNTKIIFRLPLDVGLVEEPVESASSSSSEEPPFFLEEGGGSSSDISSEGTEFGIAEGESSSPASSSSSAEPVARTSSIVREVLFGNQGKNVRYWGYCFPLRKSDATVVQRNDTGFPGLLFLSEAERAYRAKKKSDSIATREYSVLRPPSKSQLEPDLRPAGRIRHQKEVFEGGEECFIMTNRQLFVGADPDGDGLNNELEKKYGTDPENPDSDEDGLPDSTEVFDLHTDPKNRDSDHDSLVDGLEVHGHSTVEPGDTDPLNADSDHDGLCDGLCPLSSGGRTCADFTHTIDCVVQKAQWIGEDRNLDGVKDTKETDPLKWASLDDGVGDLQRYYNCLLDQKTDC